MNLRAFSAIATELMHTDDLPQQKCVPWKQLGKCQPALLGICLVSGILHLAGVGVVYDDLVIPSHKM